MITAKDRSTGQKVFYHPEIETLSRDDIISLQKKLLLRMGKRLSKNKAWIDHFASAGMSPEDLAADDGLENAPTLEKKDLRAQSDFPFLTVDSKMVQRYVATSGTTGAPVLFGMSPDDLTKLLPFQMGRMLSACGVKPGDRAYQGYGYGLWIGGLALDIGFQSYGCQTFPIGPGRGELVVRWLKDHQYDVASLSPLWLMRLIQVAHDAGIDPAKEWNLKIGVIGGQSVSKGFREQLENALPPDFKAHNIYGASEAGGPVLAISTPYTYDADEMQLINEDTIITEILDPDTMKPVSPGEVGEIVITTLCKQASPLVRWRTRDLVRLSPNAYDCPSGRVGFPRIGRIIGRTDDMLKVRGVIVFPSQVEDIITSCPQAVKDAWQIYIDGEQTGLDQMTIAVECRRECAQSSHDLVEAIKRRIHDRLGLKCFVECHEEGALPRYDAKAKRVIQRKDGLVVPPLN